MSHYPPCEIIEYQAKGFFCRRCKLYTENPIIEVSKGSLTDFQEVDIPHCNKCGQASTMLHTIPGAPDAK